MFYFNKVKVHRILLLVLLNRDGCLRDSNTNQQEKLSVIISYVCICLLCEHDPNPLNQNHKSDFKLTGGQRKSKSAPASSKTEQNIIDVLAVMILAGQSHL